MCLIKTGGGVTDIRGGFGGVYFHRDKAGLHVARKPRNIHRRSTDQDKQRKAFAAARRYSKDNRTVSYLMYRYLTGLPLNHPDLWTTPLSATNPGGTYSNVPFTIDDSTPPESTYAEETNVHTTDATYIEFRLVRPILCDKIRFHVDSQKTSGRHMEADIYYDDSWHEIYDKFHFPRLEWIEVEFPKRNIISARVRIPTEGWVRQHEFDFHTLNNPTNNEPHWPVPLDYQIPHLQGP